MFAKCIVFLAVVAQIYATPCSKVACEAPVVAPCTGAAVASAVSSGTGATVKNVVAKGKYPVALKNCGPTPDKQIPIVTSNVNAPTQVKPTVRLPCAVPAPRTICHTCTCYKTVLRPRVNQQIITVPTIERYISNSHRPIIENIQYEAIPINCGAGSCSTGLQCVEVGSCAPVLSAPVAPISPCGPVVPFSPCAPCGPVAPISPCAPCAPCAPVAPISPCAPVTPISPCSPCAPVAPVCPPLRIVPCSPVSRLPCGCY